MKHKQTGDVGEEIAADWLQQKGYSVLYRNWRYGRSEVDIVAQINDILVFVEVKTRSSTHFGYPEQFVTSAKESFLLRAADGFRDQFQYVGELRFDVIAITYPPVGSPEIHHVVDAFYGC